MKLNILKLAMMSTLAVVAVDGFAAGGRLVVGVADGSTNPSSQSADGRLCPDFAQQLNAVNLSYTENQKGMPELSDPTKKFLFSPFSKVGSQHYSTLVTYEMNGRSYTAAVVERSLTSNSIQFSIGPCVFKGTLAGKGAGQAANRGELLPA